MSKHKSIFYVFLSVFLFSCATAATTSIDPQLRRKAAAIEIITTEDIGSRGYTIIGEVSGQASALGENGFSQVEIELAQHKMKIEAAKMNADAVINYLLEYKEAVIKGKLICTGDAITWEENK